MKKMKRWIALMLCICMAVAVVSPEMLSKAEETGDASNAETTLYTLNDEEHFLHYQGDFASSEDYEQALGDNLGINNKFNLQDGQLTITGTSSLSTRYEAMFAGIASSALQNYTITADVTMQSDATSKFGGVVAYGANGTGYEFAICNSGFRLYQRGNAETLYGATKDSDFDYTKAIRLSLTAITNYDENGVATSVTLICRVAQDGMEKIIYNGQDTTDIITSGIPGVRAIPKEKTCTIDNVSVIRKQQADTISLYSDDFSDTVEYNAALGSYAYNVYAMPWDSENQKLSYPSDAEKEAGVALFKGLSNASKLQDYTIEAKVKKGLQSQYVALISYGTEGDGNATNGYEFALVNSGTTATNFRLGYRKDGQFTPLKDAEGNNQQINVTQVSGLGVTTNLVDEEILMRMSAVTNDAGNVELKCYAAYNGTEKIIFECVADGAVTGITCGAPGVRTHSKGTTIDDINITQKGSSSVLYKDSFTRSEGYGEALGANGTVTNKFAWNNQAVTITGVVGDATRYDSIFAGITDSSNLQNYTIEADITMNSSNTSVFGGVVAYAGDGTGYEFAINGNGFRLFQRGTNEQLYPVTADDDFIYAEPIRLSLTALTNYNENNEAVSVTLICKASQGDIEKTICEVKDETNIITLGAPGLRSVPKSLTCTVDDICITQMPDNYMGLSEYRNNGEYTAPTKEGYVFGGWYTDASLKTPLSKDVKIGGAYAKWVDEDVLSVKAQLDANTTGASDTAKTKLRFVTTVDCLDYDKVGFVVSTPKKTATFEDTTAYRELHASGVEVSYKPEDISSESVYFVTMILGNLAVTESDLDKVFTVTPFWVTADGTTVEGITRNDITIQKGIDANTSGTSNSYSLR